MNTLTNIKQMYKLLDYLPKSDISKQLILEPLSCVLKLSLLQWKPIGTKISVYNNSLHYHEPTMYQGILRSWGGDSRQDLHNICHPIIKCLDWYSKDDDIYQFFYSESIKGLIQLKKSYDSNSLINHTIDHYIAVLDGKSEQESIEDNAVIIGLKDMWTEKEISILHTMLEHILSIDDQDKDMYVEVFEHLLDMKEQKVCLYIHNISSSYQKE